MSIAARLASALAILGVLGAAAAGAALGVALARQANTPAQRLLALSDPRGATGDAPVLRSAGGFTGFDGPAAIGGAAVRTGTISATADGTFAVASPGSTLAIRATAPSRLFHIARASAPLAAGDAVIVRVQTDGAAIGVLRLPADLHEDERRGLP